MEPHSYPPYNVWLHRYAILLAICTLFLVVAGASVTSKEAGLSVPDWPLSYGHVMPEMTGGVLFETGHRLIATTVGLMTILMAVWLQRVDPRSWMRKLGWWALGAVIAQGLLGGITVLWLQPPAVSTAHACLAQLFFSTTVAMALFTSRGWQAGPEVVEDYGWPSLRGLAIVAPLMVLGQVALGAAFRHRALSLIPHIAGAVIVTLSILIVGVFVLSQFPKHPALKRAAHVMLGITTIQVFLGLGAYSTRMDAANSPLAMVLVTVAHVATGGLTLASTIMLSIQIRRNVRARATEPGPSHAVVAR
ncbi:MAG: COX15/CtaA family protein [Acidobacteriota bacterium]